MWQARGIIFLIRQDFVTELIGNFNGKRILDFGCGVGTLLNNMSIHKNALFDGLDANPRAIKLAKLKERGNVKFFLGNHLKNNIKNHHYNYIICMEVLEHIENEKEVIDFLKKKLRPGGSVIVTVPSRKKELRFTHFRVYKKNDLRKVFESEGFKTSYMKSYGFPLLRFFLMIFEIQNKLARRREKSEIMRLCFFGGIKKSRLYIMMIPVLRFVLRLDDIFSFMDMGIGVIARFDLETTKKHDANQL